MKTGNHAVTFLTGIMLTVALSLAPAATLWAGSGQVAAPPPPSMATVQSAYGHLPLSFEANEGQTDSSVQFLTRGRGHQLFLTPSEAVLALRTGEAKAEGQADDATQGKPFSNPSAPSHSVVRMTFDGANPQAEVVGLDQLPGIVNYFIGDDPSKWRTHIPTYQKVAYTNIYPGIDLVYYGNQGQLEYDLIVAPGADPNLIRLLFDGAETVEVDPATGDLVLTLSEPSANSALRTEHSAIAASATLHLHKPVVYQRNEQGEKHLLAGTYVLLASEASSPRPASEALGSTETPHVAFQVASYDTSQPLIIDPVLSWATYLGGSSGEAGSGIAVDQAGQAYMTGTTNTPGSGFPGTAGSLIQSTLGGFNDAFVTKLNTAGTAILYSTYLGGSAFDGGTAIAVDQAGQAYVTGSTDTPGSGFPGTAGSLIQSTYAGGADAFVAKLNAAGTALVYSTYLGGSGNDRGLEIAVDPAGQAYVTGDTDTPGSGFPGTAGSLIQSTFAGGFDDAFVTKLNAAGTSLVYSTYLGGSGFDAGSGITVDQAGNAYVTGFTDTPGSGFPGTAGSLIQSTYAGGADAFVAKLNAAGTALLYSTYLGGSGDDFGSGIAVDQVGQAYVTGSTARPGSGFPGTAGSLIQNTLGMFRDAFVTKLNAAGTALVYSTYLGGSGEDAGTAIAVDQAGQAYVTGVAGFGFPGTAGSPIQSTFAGPGRSGDAFVTKLNAAGTALLYSTYLGGVGFDAGSGIAVDQAGNAYVTGNTDTPGSGFPGTAGSIIQSTNGGDRDAFVAKITTNLPFAAFRAKAEIDLRHRPHHDEFEARHGHHEDEFEGHHRRQKKDEFEMTAIFTLDPNNNGIAPLTEAVTVQVGTFATTIPAGSFTQKKGRFTFEGVIDGVKLEAVLRSLILGNDYEFKVEGKGADLTGTENPVTVGLTIGDDSGSKTIRAKIE
jgi:hypothetical protein